MKDLTTGKESTVLIRFALPMLLGNVFQQFYTFVDGIIVGRFISDSALAAVGASFPIVFLMISLMTGVTMGSSIILSQFFGAGKKDSLGRIVSTTMIAIVLGGVIISVIGIIFVGPLLSALKTPAEVLAPAVSYMQVLFVGMTFQFGFNAISGILRGLGDSKNPLIFLAVTSLLNAGLDYLFVAVLHYGVEGAAWATNISIFVSFVLSFFYMQKAKGGLLKIDIRKHGFDRDIFFKMMKIGIPAGLQQSLVSLGFLALNRIINPFGKDVLAGYTAASRLDSFASMPAMNISLALTSFVGQNLGAGKIDRVKKGYHAALLISFGLAVVTTLTMLIFAKPLIAIFNSNPEMINYGAQYLVTVSLFYPAFTTMFVTGGVLRGAGDTMVQFVITLFALWVIRIPAAAFLASIWGVQGIWWGIPLGWLFGAGATSLYYLSKRWMRKKVV